MRLTNLCFLSLALCFTLTSLLHPKAAHGGDAILPPGCCKFFCDADFAPLDADLYSRAIGKGSSGSSVRKKSVAPLQTLIVPPSSRTWNFSYRAPGKATRISPPAILRQHRFVCSYCNPHQPEPNSGSVSIGSLKKQVAPILFRDAGSWSDMTFLMRLLVGEFAATVSSCTAPFQQLPSRVVRFVGDVIQLH